MLLEFSCSNFRSIKNTVTFSMVGTKGSEGNKRYKVVDKLNIARIASIYGANGSGKSNFIQAVEYVKFLVANSMTIQPGNRVPQFQHKLCSVNEPSEFQIQFIKNGVRYSYGLSILDGCFVDEYLIYFPNKRPVKIFTRHGMDIISGRNYKNSFNLAKTVLKENRLFLSCAANYSGLIEVEDAFKFFNNDIVVYKTAIDSPSFNNWYEYSAELMRDNVKIKQKFIDVMRKLGTGIVDIETTVEKITSEKLLDGVPEPVRQMLLQNETNELKNYKTRIIYDNFSTDLMYEESTGIKKLFQIICPLLDIISSGKVLLCDEIETGLHEAIVYKIIELFYDSDFDKFAQLIFTTHDTNLLDLNLFERDQIWFTQLDANRATDLYSLVEIKNVRKNEKISARYIEGKYGAIPALNFGD